MTTKTLGVEPRVDPRLGHISLYCEVEVYYNVL